MHRLGLFEHNEETTCNSKSKILSLGDGHLELSLPSVEITNLSVSDRPSPSASPELKSVAQNGTGSYSGLKAERSSPDSAENTSRAQMIQDLKVQLQGTDVRGFAWLNVDHKVNWDQPVGKDGSDSGNNSGSRDESTSPGSNSRAVTPDITPITSPENLNKYTGQFQKHFALGTILSPGIPGILPPLISSTPYVANAVSRVHARSYSENDAVVAKEREEPVNKQKPFRPWECNTDSVKQEVEVKPKNEIGEKLKMQRTSSLNAAIATNILIPEQPAIGDQTIQRQAPTEDMDPLRKAMVVQHSKLVEDLSWLQQHRPSDPQVFGVCRDYSAQVDHLERSRYQTLSMAATCPESGANIDAHYDQQRLELLRSVTHNISSLKAISYHYQYSYHVPDIPYFQPISMVSNQLPQPPNYYHHLTLQPEARLKRRSDTKCVAKMECHYVVAPSQESPIDPSSGSTSTDSAYHSLSNNSSSSDTSTSSSTSNDNVKLIEQVDRLCPQAPYENEELRPKYEHTGANNKENRLLNRQAVRYMEYWYNLHFDHPYPTDVEAQELARKGGITVAQVKKWMANKRVRSYNTLSFNGSIHPRKLKRLRQQQEMVYTQLSRANVRYNPIAVIPRM